MNILDTLELITPLATQLGIGGVAGFCVGYAMKKVAKLAAMMLGVFFIGLQYLAYKGIIAIDYNALKSWASSLVGEAGEAQGLIIDIFANLPFGTGLAGGILFGLKKG